MASTTRPRCRYWLAGFCKFSAEDCEYKHPANSQEGAEWRASISKTSTRMCRHFLAKGCCDFGDRCGFLHARDKNGPWEVSRRNASEPGVWRRREAKPRDDGVYKRPIPRPLPRFLYRLPVHGLHLSSKQIAEFRESVDEDLRSAFDEDMSGDRLGFTADFDGERSFDPRWAAPKPGRDASIEPELPCIVDKVFELARCPICTGETKNKSDAKGQTVVS